MHSDSMCPRAHADAQSRVYGWLHHIVIISSMSGIYGTSEAGAVHTISGSAPVGTSRLSLFQEHVVSPYSTVDPIIWPTSGKPIIPNILAPLLGRTEDIVIKQVPSPSNLAAVCLLVSYVH